MLKPFVVGAVLSAALLGVWACQSSPGRGASSPATGELDEPIRLTEVAPPPGIDARMLTPLEGEALTRSQLSLDEVIAALDTPPWLGGDKALGGDNGKPLPPRGEEEPPLAAQKFYAAGRVALLEGDNFQAVQQFEKALRLSPGNARILARLGYAWGRAGNRVSAANFYRQAYAADPSDLDSLLMLGRFALEDRRWDQAIATLHHADKLSEPSAVTTPEVAPEAAPDANTPQPIEHDAATRALLKFYLAGALNEAGYARAAAGVYRDYLEVDRDDARHSSHENELAAIDAQQGQTLLIVGDIHHRLGEPQLALRVYELASDVGVLNEDALRRRLIYTRLRLGQTRAAEDLAVEAVTDDRGSERALALIPYVVAHGVAAQPLADRLTTLYESEGRPASLALAMADALPRDEAAALLNRHLSEKPGDDAVFGRLVTLLLEGSPSDDRHEQALRATLASMAASPQQAGAYVDRLLSASTPGTPGTPGSPDSSGAAGTALLETFERRIKPETMATDAEASVALALRGRLLSAAGQPEAAALSYEEALRRDAGNVMARTSLASLAIDRGDFTAADALLAPLADSDDPRVAELRVRTLIETGQDDAALALLNDVLRRSPPGSPLAMDKARLLLKLKRVPEAERVLLDLLNARPTDESIYAMLLAMYDEHPDMSRNYQRLVRRMIDTIPDARVTRMELANLHLASRDFAAAEKLLGSVLAENPEDTEARRLMLEVYAGTNRADAFRSSLDAFLSENVDAELDEDFFRLVEAYLRQINDEERLYRVVELRLAREEPSFQRSLTVTQLRFQQKRYAEAADAVREALEFQVPEDPRLAFILCRIFTESLLSSLEAPAAGEQTLELMKKHPAIGPDLAQTLASQYEARGERERSLAFLEEAVKLFPQDAQLNNSLGYSLANAGVRLEDAKRMIGVAVEAEPETAAYLDSMGWVHYKLGDFGAALDYLERGRNADGGSHPVILDHLGDTYHRVGKLAQAVRAWSQAQAILSQPDYQRADPEEEGLDERLAAKIKAVAEDAQPSVAPLGEGVAVPTAPPAPRPMPEAPAPAPGNAPGNAPGTAPGNAPGNAPVEL